jgi:hypothetical protein
MVNNYAYMAKDGRGPTIYNHYNSGGDGLYWDCIQLIHLAKDVIVLENKSPFWKCDINGIRQSKQDVDASYVHMLQDFLEIEPQDKLWGHDEIKMAHVKTARFQLEDMLK